MTLKEAVEAAEVCTDLSTCDVTTIEVVASHETSGIIFAEGKWDYPVCHAFDKFGGSLGATGSVTYMFENKGVVVLEKVADFDSDKAMELALEVEALDCEDDEVFTVYCEPNASEVNRISSAFADAGYTILSAEVEMIPQNYVTLNEHQKETFEKMLAKLDESDDVQEVIHNLED